MSSPPGDPSPEELGQQLLRATHDEDLPRVLEVLNEGADVNYRGEVGETALIVAAMNLDLNMVMLLLAKGADKTITSSPDGDFEGRNAVENAQHFARDHPENPHGRLIILLLSDDPPPPPGVAPPGGEPAGGAKKKNKKGGRRFTRKQCKKFRCAKMGFTQKASCRPYKNCYRQTKQKKTAKSRK
jgi:hypothetical protein